MERCIELANQLIDELKRNDVDPVTITMAEEIRDDIEDEYGDMNESQGDETSYEDNGELPGENPDKQLSEGEGPEDELDKFASDEVEKKTGKPVLKIMIKGQK